MKRTIAILLGLMTVGISCKKQYTCACTQTYTEPAYEDNNGTYHQPYTYITSHSNSYKMKEKDAVSTCKSSESVYSSPSYNSGQGPSLTTITCELY